METETESEILARALGECGFADSDRERLAELLASIDLPAWFETIDHSAYALADWLRAFAAFDAWLTEQNIEARPARAMLGYLDCCTLTAAATLSPPEFSRLLRENLDRHGFDATRPASA